MNARVKFLQDETLKLLRGARLRVLLSMIPQLLLLAYVATSINDWDAVVSIASFVMIFLFVGSVWWVFKISMRIRFVKKMINGDIPLNPF